MRPQRVSAESLADRESRAIAKLASVARNDVYSGGARAMVLAKKLAALGSKTDYQSVVSDVYTSHNGISRQFMAYECAECGTIHLGEDSALECCAETYDDTLETSADDND